MQLLQSKRAQRFPTSTVMSVFEDQTDHGKSEVLKDFGSARDCDDFTSPGRNPVLLPLCFAALACLAWPMSALPSHAALPPWEENAARSGFTASLPSPSAYGEVKRVQSLEDQRLTQCEENGKDWEQCFFFDTSPMTQSASTVERKKLPSMISPVQQNPSTSRSGGVPTW
jgi:hypothetical protein